MNKITPNSGNFLVAKSILEGTWFENKIIFLADHSENGSYGLTINFSATMPLREVFSGLDKDNNQNGRFFIGGPVQEELVQIIQCNFSTIDQAVEVFPKIFMGGTWNDDDFFLEKLLHRENLRFYLGYSGWAPFQLEAEIKQGCWDIIQVPPLDVFSLTDDELRMTSEQFLERFSS